MAVLSNEFPPCDVRSDRIGFVNSVINSIFIWRGLSFCRPLIKYLLHVELPELHYGIRFPHPFCIVVNGRAKIGKNVTIYQGVTIGSKRYGGKAGVPVVGSDVVIYPGAVIVGSVLVGDRATIGPGSVVISDVPAGSVVGGNPARVLRSQG